LFVENSYEELICRSKKIGWSDAGSKEEDLTWLYIVSVNCNLNRGFRVVKNVSAMDDGSRKSVGRA
jgi:hypothetical protein